MWRESGPSQVLGDPFTVATGEFMLNQLLGKLQIGQFIRFGMRDQGFQSLRNIIKAQASVLGDNLIKCRYEVARMPCSVRCP